MQQKEKPRESQRKEVMNTESGMFESDISRETYFIWPTEVSLHSITSVLSYM